MNNGWMYSKMYFHILRIVLVFHREALGWEFFFCKVGHENITQANKKIKAHFVRGNHTYFCFEKNTHTKNSKKQGRTRDGNNQQRGTRNLQTRFQWFRHRIHQLRWRTPPPSHHEPRRRRTQRTILHLHLSLLRLSMASSFFPGSKFLIFSLFLFLHPFSICR